MQPTTVEACDEALRECVKRMRLARKNRDKEALIVYGRQCDRLLGWRHELKTDHVAK